MEMALSLRQPRTCVAQLVVPQNSVTLDERETEYLDGGYQVNSGWWGVSVTMNGEETRNFVEDQAYADMVISSVAGVLGGPAGAIAAVVLGTYTYMISRMNRNNSGVTLLWSWLTSSYIVPTVIDNY